MKVGGNASATEFYNRHGGSGMLSGSDGRAKYLSPIAGKYKEELERRKAEDVRK